MVMMAAAAFLVGACIGSFLNVVIHRLPREESIVSPRSRCPGCGRPIRAWENIPIVSFIVPSLTPSARSRSPPSCELG